MCGDLCVRGRVKRITEFSQPVPQNGIILDHAVMNKNNLAIPARMRMGIDIARLTMRCPPGMTDPCRPVDRVLLAHFGQLRYSSRFFANSNLVAVLQGDPGAIVPAIFQTE